MDASLQPRNYILCFLCEVGDLLREMLLHSSLCKELEDMREDLGAALIRVKEDCHQKCVLG